MKTNVKVYDVMTSKPVTVSPETTLIECARKMKEHRIGSLLVKEGKLVIGIITEDDFVRKVVAENMDIKKTSVGEVMIRKLITIGPGKDIYEAIKTMAEHGIKQLPVTEESKLVGMLTWKDILTVQPQLFDVFIEKANITDNAMEKRMKGKCNICGHVKELREVDRQFICADCAKT